jgi:raffinose/stachyose/melibiose transport system substrate-binding protein
LLGVTGAGGGGQLLCSCGDDEAGASAIDWWHIGNTDPLLSVWAAAAVDYQNAQSGVKINITPLENEAFKAKLTTVA